MPQTRSAAARENSATATAIVSSPIVAASSLSSSSPPSSSSSTTIGTRRRGGKTKTKAATVAAAAEEKDPARVATSGRMTSGIDETPAGATEVESQDADDGGRGRGRGRGNGIETEEVDSSKSWTARNQWVVYAITSGACAAFNGVFAKLTTNDLTTHISRGISRVIGLQNPDVERMLEVVVRCAFFALNLVFNGVMWTLFTQALSRGNSTTQVSIMNTSTNFMITALLGFVIFSESLPPLWWVGAGMLVAGNVIIGRKDEETNTSSPEQDRAEATSPEVKDDEDEDVPLLGNLELR
ncbi:hypothetical protein F5Y16DRAFT_66158 [Xylariaceae sp. FL0255]|nr:hypothetical protein F5Y16DRAFT_66158 [Xylariaceae sp. FL0255]